MQLLSEMTDTVSPELMQALTQMLVSALRTSVDHASAEFQRSQDGASMQPRPPAFSMSEYHSSEETSVADYFKRFEWAFKLSKIPEAQYANYARLHMGAELNTALKFLVSPRDPEGLQFAEIRTTLVNHFDQTKNKYVESIKFRQIVQHKGESVANFSFRLKQGAAHYEYDTFLDRMLIEQLLHGLESRDMCDEIIAQKPTTFNAAYEIAYSLEATRNTANEVRTTEPAMAPETTNKLGYETPKTKKGEQLRYRALPQESGQQLQGSCNSCGGQHPRSQCRFREAKCYKCDKTGHIAKVCRARKSTPQDFPTNQVQSEALPAAQIDSVQLLNQIYETAPPGKQSINAKIDGRNLEMELDTGAPCGIIGVSRLREIKPHFSLQKTNRKFSSFTGHHIDCLGRIPVNVTIGSTTRKLNLYVVSRDTDTLLGREWISHFIHEINLNRLFSTDRVNLLTSESHITTEQNARLNQLLTSFDDTFSEVPGKLTGPPVTVHLKPGTVQIFAKARDVPLALRDQYAKEIDAKIASRVYERVEYLEWASPTHIVAKKNGKLRITGNYKPTVNPRMIIDEHPIPKIEYIFNKMKGATLFCQLDVTDAYTHLPIDEIAMSLH